MTMDELAQNYTIDGGEMALLPYLMVADISAQKNIAPVALLIVLLGVIYRTLIYPVFVSPLSRFPTVHWSCHISPFWNWHAKYHGWENRKILAAHQEKGHIVRIAPNVLHLNCGDGLKSIYMGDFPRTKFYWAAFRNYNVPSMVTYTKPADHATRRKLFATIFTKSAVMNSSSLHAVFRCVLFERLLPIMQQKCISEQPFEVFSTIYGVAMDMFVCWQFGVACGSNWTQDTKDRDQYIRAYNGKGEYFFRATEIFDWINFFDRYGVKLLPKKFWENNDICEKWNLDLCDRAAHAIANQRDFDVVDEPVIFRHALKIMGGIENGIPPKSSPPSYPNRLDIAAEMFSFNAAAHEGGAIPLTWLTYELSRRPYLQDKLRKELETLPVSMKQTSPTNINNEFPSLRDIEALPLLEAVVRETMRLYPVIGGPQPRTTPADVRIGGDSVIPAGTTVECSAWSLHRNPEVFPDPEVWRPERWLEATPAELSTMRKWFWTFSSGNGMCIGLHQAMLSNKAIVALIYANFTTSIYEHGEMTPVDAYVSGPVDQEKFSVVLRNV